MDTMTETATGLLKLGDEYSAHNYHPLPVVAAEAEGAWVTDVEGRRYLDLLAAYSALNFGHRHPRLVAAARGSSTGSRWSAGRSTTTSSGRSAPSWPSWPAWTWCCR